AEILTRGLRGRTIAGFRDAYRRRTYARLVAGICRAMTAKAIAHIRSRTPDPGWVSSAFIEPLDRLVRRWVPVLFVYGELDGMYEDFRMAQSGRLGHILARGGSLVDVTTLEGHLKGFTRLQLQD